MFQFLNFIKRNRIEHLIKEDMSDMQEDLPFSANFTDRHCRPVGYVFVDGENWNVRKVILQGKPARAIRFVYKSVFDMYVRVLELGSNSSCRDFDWKFSLLINMAGFSTLQHSCAQCTNATH